MMRALDRMAAIFIPIIFGGFGLGLAFLATQADGSFDLKSPGVWCLVAAMGFLFGFWLLIAVAMISGVICGLCRVLIRLLGEIFTRLPKLLDFVAGVIEFAGQRVRRNLCRLSYEFIETHRKNLR